MESIRGWLHAGSALIRHLLHIDPDTLTDAQWAYEVKMAAWIENRNLSQQIKQ